MNKRLIVLFVCLALVVLLVVLNSTVFVVSEIIVTSDIDDDWYDQDEIISVSQINLGRNIFVVSESKASENIHSNLTDVRVISIERKFPNKVIIHITKRVPMVSIQISDESQYIITDWDLRILDIQSNSGDLYLNSTKIKGLTLDVEGNRDELIGELIDDEKFDYVKNIAHSALLMGINDIGFSSFFEEIDFSIANYVHIKTNSGVTLVLVVGTDTTLEDQFQAAYSIYVNFDINDLERNSGYIIITEEGWQWQESID